MIDPATRLFRVHARHLETSHAHLVNEASVEAAAVAWLEGCSGQIGEATVSVVVRDLATGHDHCFRIDLDTGAAAPDD